MRTDKTSPADGWNPWQPFWSRSHKLLAAVWDKGTSISTPCSEPSVNTVPDTTVTGFSPSLFRNFTPAFLKTIQSSELKFSVKSFAPWQQSFAAISGNSLLWPEIAPLHVEISEINHLVTYLNSSVPCTCFNTSSWNPKPHNLKNRIFYQKILFPRPSFCWKKTPERKTTVRSGSMNFKVTKVDINFKFQGDVI